MGFLQKNIEKFKTDLAKNKAQVRQELSFVCPECNGTMRIVLTAGALLAMQKVRCESCGLEMALSDARRGLKHPT